MGAKNDVEFYDGREPTVQAISRSGKLVSFSASKGPACLEMAIYENPQAETPLLVEKFLPQVGSELICSLFLGLSDSLKGNSDSPETD